MGFRFVKGSVKKIIDIHLSLDITLLNLFLTIEKLKKDIQSVKGKKGSLIIFNDELLHSGELIKTNKCRVSLEFTFCFNKKLN